MLGPEENEAWQWGAQTVTEEVGEHLLEVSPVLPWDCAERPLLEERSSKPCRINHLAGQAQPMTGVSRSQ